ncbi:MAG: TetR/AcrR family transcriptional regulator [Oscillospiraceae bacterium]|nr:TetR/AcrR family transcriptional regulator [Oscillospiraceae bacterium]MBR6836631.1 TetR/AcrR family transcriptional regulator [Oscillospiraceae bacterium]
MQHDNESREKLIASAKKEFLEKGFEKASLRSISSAAGLTTGAVYFFFRDKNGLFGAVVDEPVQKIMSVINEHFAADMEVSPEDFTHSSGDHDDFADALISALYSDRDAVLILLEKASGSVYENIVDKFIEMMEQYNAKLAENYLVMFPDKRVDEYMLHWLSHVQINAFVHLVTHEVNVEKAAREIKSVLDMLIESWIAHILTDKE